MVTLDIGIPLYLIGHSNVLLLSTDIFFIFSFVPQFLNFIPTMWLDVFSIKINQAWHQGLSSYSMTYLQYLFIYQFIYFI